MRVALGVLCACVLAGQAWPDPVTPLGHRTSFREEIIREAAEADTLQVSQGRKIPGLAFLASAAVPGAGQAYMGQWKTAAVFAGLEVLGWVLYFSEENKGKDLETEYKRFADDNYVFSAEGTAGYDPLDAWTWGWAEFYDEFLGYPTYPDTFPEIRDDFYDNYRAKNSDYYAQIESENRYIYGWTDWNGLASGPQEEPWKYFVSSLREQYKAKRRKANDKLKRADYILALPVVLRVVSSTLALNMARAHNASLEITEDVSLRWRVGWPEAEPTATLALEVSY
jgi:hypothetical protein